ncbi:MAG: hypothetical protein LBL85_05260 [Methanocalculaceae archaeon]|nr:hypothetical protein [Methanocalculaceae archaeon]
MNLSDTAALHRSVPSRKNTERVVFGLAFWVLGEHGPGLGACGSRAETPSMTIADGRKRRYRQQRLLQKNMRVSEDTRSLTKPA